MSSTTDIINLTDDEIQIYWEAQESAFCAVHTIDNLLQSPYYTEIEFSALAQQLDANTAALLASDVSNTTVSTNEMKSDNVDESGNFSIEVLLFALKIFDVELINLHRSDAVQYQHAPETADAYILHMYNHWIAIRKINGEWYNLNSLLPHGPELITVTYLAEFIAQMQAQGFTALVVIGQLPLPTQYNSTERGKYYTHQQCIENCKKPRTHRTRNRPRHNSQDELQRAIAASMGDSVDDDIMTHDNDEDDSQLQAVLQQSRQSNEEAQLQAAIRASMQQ